MKPIVNIVWFKRDLRVSDHVALHEAIQTDLPYIPIFIKEDFYTSDPHYDPRHLQFIWQSLKDIELQQKLHIWRCEGSVLQTFKALQTHYSIAGVYSHMETGLSITFDRDKAVKKYLQEHAIPWHEFENNGVFRKRQNRNGWREDWRAQIGRPIIHLDRDVLLRLALPPAATSLGIQEWTFKKAINKNFQPGGSSRAQVLLKTFLEERQGQYMQGISKPLSSQTSCSRLSPYIAWGNISIRQVYQAATARKKSISSKRNLDAFMSRLRWQAHFIQKFEMECAMEFRCVNRGFTKFLPPVDSAKLEAWKEGQTGVPLVDACMRCLQKTGYINFRMRAMLVSFAVHYLWLPWQSISQHLASVFLDFEPGIHYPQIQMQAGVTGINTVRIYNPIKQSIEQDPDASFLKVWLPELAHLPIAFIHEPWKMSSMERLMYSINEHTYPAPIIDLEAAGRNARDKVWQWQKDPAVRQEAFRIIAKHTTPARVV